MPAGERIVIVSGPGQGKVFEVSGQMTIGRSPDSTIYLEDIQASRRHARIDQTPEGTILRDLGSGNGTMIGDERIVSRRLENGDVFRVGTALLRYEIKDQASVKFQANVQEYVKGLAAANIYETFFQRPERAATLEQQRDAQQRLAAVYKANQIIASERDLHKLFERVMDQLFSLVRAHNGVIMLVDEKTGELRTEYVKSGSGGGLVISTTIVNRAFKQGEGVITFDAAGDSRFDGRSIIVQNISSAMCTPLIHQEKTLGVLYVDTRGTKHAFTTSDLELLVAVSGPSATAISNSQYMQRLERQYHDTLVGIATLVEMRDHYTVGHTWRVTLFAVEIARSLGWDEERIAQCEMGGVLHDVGKIAVDDAILRKPEKLTDEEYSKMKVHPERGAQFLRDWEMLRPLVPYCLYHHERYDGRGYPFGMAGEDIPIEGRVIAVADTFDAMTSSRPYRKGLPAETAIAELQRGRGTQFDPKVVDALVKCYEEGKISRIIQESLKGGMSIVCPFCSTYISIPEVAVEGDKFQCGVCHRHVQLQQANEAMFGVLLPEA